MKLYLTFLLVKHWHYKVLVRWNNCTTRCHGISKIESAPWVYSTVRTCRFFVRDVFAFRSGTMWMESTLWTVHFSTKLKSCTIQTGRAFFKPSTHVSMWCNMNGRERVMLILKKPSTIQDDRTIFKSLIRQTHYMQYVNGWLSDVEQPNPTRLTTELHRSGGWTFETCDHMF